MAAEPSDLRQAARCMRQLLAALDASLYHIEELRLAFKLDNPTRALAAITAYQRSSAIALCAVLSLESATNHPQHHAWDALNRLHHIARGPLALAWALVSQLPHTPNMRDRA